MNLAQNAEAMAAGGHPGYEATALDGLSLSLEVLNEKRIKVVINGGALNPKGLAEKIQTMVSIDLEIVLVKPSILIPSQIEEKKLDLKVAWVSGDNLMGQARELFFHQMKHLDSANPHVKLVKDTDNFIDDPRKPIISCNAYLGARAITKGLREGADIIICEVIFRTLCGA